MQNNIELKASDYYDYLSSKYDAESLKPNAWMSNLHLDQALRQYLTGATVKQVLDVACGTGQTTKTILDWCPDAQIVGIDISEKMIEKAREKIPQAHFKQGTLKACVDESTESTTDKFDLIVCIGALEFFPDLQDFFSPLSQVLAKNGNVFFTYEPLMHNFIGQEKPSELTSLSNSDDSQKLELMTFRRTALDISMAAHETGLIVQDLELFVAYYKGDRPVIYSICQARF